MQKIYFGTMTKSGDTYKAVMEAFQAGYKYFDFAEVYGNQAEIGQAITDWFKNNPTLKRADYFFQSKVWVTDIDNNNVDQAVMKILKDLHLEYIDSLLVHRPSMDLNNSINAYKKLIAWKNKGIVKHVGISNFEKEHIVLLWSESGVKPEMHQFEMNIFNQRWDRVVFAQKHGIESQVYGALKRHEQSSEVEQLAKKHNVSTNQIVMSWLKHHHLNPVLKSTNFEHMKENLANVTIQLTDAELAVIKNLNRYENSYSEGIESSKFRDFYNQIKN
ncbi:aldo/keto reductase [Williamsoniiplasma luminosum]|uniref:Aldo/keto reductase n=1 Tax=Williamsoniiplasma luminosum TaxID=214888 RepID=A0A2K8NTU7_9MOLU|nr:aldo/keto reductase [Williamsoniiplasma luminosum]ATZ17184.1 aldo/keto reductase [Williamsoniiplasma luminosum]